MESGRGEDAGLVVPEVILLNELVRVLSSMHGGIWEKVISAKSKTLGGREPESLFL